MDETDKVTAAKSAGGEPELCELKIRIPPDLYRAFQRCVWIRVHETGCSQLDIMHELVEEFLRRHGC